MRLVNKNKEDSDASGTITPDQITKPTYISSPTRKSSPKKVVQKKTNLVVINMPKRMPVIPETP